MSDALRNLLPFLACQIPLVGAAYKWWEQVQQHQITAALLAIGYEFLVLAGAVIKAVWTDELKKDVVKFTADWVRAGVKGFAPGFLRRYRKQMIIEHNIFNVRGLGLIDAVTLNLDQVFVELQIAQSNRPAKASLDLVAAREMEGSRTIWDFVNALRRRSNAPMALAVIGPPGCGKTTTLQHIAVTLAANRQRRYRSRAYVPVLLFLREHIAKITQEEQPSLAKLVQQYFAVKHPIARLNPPEDWFAKRLDAGRCMVLLDGLDEVADAEQRQIVSAWVDQQIENYPKCPFILTARPQGYRDAPLKRAHVLEALPFNARQIHRFIHNWYLASETVSFGHKQDEGVRQRATKGTKELLKALKEKPPLNDLTVNPLLLTMVAMVHRYHGALPGSRIELYAEICQVLLGRWRQAKGAKDKLSAEQKLVVLRPLAAHMMANKIREISVSSAKEVIASPLERIGMSYTEAEKFLGDMQSSSGLLLEREAGQWSFAHLTFQEYLTATHWLEYRGVSYNWPAMVSDSWWQETLRLYAAQSDATPVAQACLGVDTITALILAADCLDEAREIAPEVRLALEEYVIGRLDSEDREQRCLAAEVKLARRLTLLERIDDHREIDPGVLTCAEYQLFLEETRVQEKYHQPDHWPSHTFAKGNADKPIAGIRAKDAEAFCLWLTRRKGGDVVYRLPRTGEVSDNIQSKDEIAFWYKDNGEFHLAGLPKAVDQKIKQVESRYELVLPSWQPYLLSASTLDGDDITRALGVAQNGVLILNQDLLSTLSKLVSQILASHINHAHGHARILSYNLALALDRKVARGLASDLTQVLDDARNHAHNRDKYLAIASDISDELDRNKEFAQAVERERSKDHNSSSAKAFDRDQALAYAREHDRNRNLTMARANTLARNLALSLAHAIDRTADYSSARTIDLYLKRAEGLDDVLATIRRLTQAKDFGFSQTDTIVGALDRALARDLYPPFGDDLNLAYNLSAAQTIKLTFRVIPVCLSNLNYALARSLDPRLQDLNTEFQRFANERGPAATDTSRLQYDLKKCIGSLPPHIHELLLDVLAFIAANTPFDLRHAQRRIVARMLEIALSIYQKEMPSDGPTWWELSWQRQADVVKKQSHELAQQLYSWLRVIIAREEDKLFAWEGIRIVRESPKDSQLNIE